MNRLTITQFGNPVLRQKCKSLSVQNIKSAEIKQLITDMRHTLVEKKLGIGLAAPQVGRNVALTIIIIQPTKHRPEVEPFEAVMINPEIIKTKGNRKQVWEGCISAGSNGKADLFAKVPRYKEVSVRFLDKNGASQVESFNGLVAQVVQHEVDHLNGVLFVDRVKDTKTYKTYKEYMKAKKQERK
ncbi:MAG: peptide deformylase [Candidatus Saccharibacteria bacterium]|nr:peptide deformylase [Candidatus Saccharibacteria bacterium]